MSQDIRWEQRFQNLQHACAQMRKGLAIPAPNDIEKQGIIQSFEFTFELAWKTMKNPAPRGGVSIGIFKIDNFKNARR